MLKSHCNQVGQVPNFALYSGNLICACDFHTLQPAGMGGDSFHDKPCKQTCIHGTGSSSTCSESRAAVGTGREL